MKVVPENLILLEDTVSYGGSDFTCEYEDLFKIKLRNEQCLSNCK